MAPLVCDDLRHDGDIQQVAWWEHCFVESRKAVHLAITCSYIYEWHHHLFWQAIIQNICSDNTNIFASSTKAPELETIINQEGKEWGNINKLSINLRKKNDMIIKSAKRKLPVPVNLKITNQDNSIK